jgi:hypothetical protein
MAEKTPSFPLHRLNRAQTMLWLRMPGSRMLFASNLLKRYPRSGVGMVSATMRLFAIVDPSGKIRELSPPFKRFDMWQMSNAPGLSECACRHYFDPEVGGSWKERGANAGHHPFCQFKTRAMVLFEKAERSAHEQLSLNRPPQKRPDEWFELSKEEA